MKIKTTDLEGAALDWAVAEADGYEDDCVSDEWNYSTDWAQGGPIIEREKINIEERTKMGVWLAYSKCANTGESSRINYGPTPLIAAMRCYVASKLGEEVEVPYEVTKEEV